MNEFTQHFNDALAAICDHARADTIAAAEAYFASLK